VVDYLTEYKDLVRVVASIKHKEYPMVQLDDITQELWLWFVEHPNKVKEWYNLEDQKVSIKLFARALHNAASKYCQYEKARTSGYEISDIFYYKRDIVEELLPGVISGNLIEPENINDLNSGRAAKTPSEGNNLLAMQVDISSAYGRIKPEQQNILKQWYLSNRNSKDLAKELGTNEKTARMRVLRAIDAIIKKLGGPAPYGDRDYRDITTE
jgi:RNA polymerase sigma factor (sigma-70 family)